MSWSRYDDYENEPPFEDERPCGNCIHKKNGKCESWECNYEEKPPMTIEDAIAVINTEVEVDYDGKTEEEVEEIDKAFEILIATVKRYIKRDCAEWEEWKDGATGRITGAGLCSKCGKYSSWQTRFCHYCGSQMKNYKKTETEE